MSYILDTFHSCNLDAPQNIGKEIAVAKCDAIDLNWSTYLTQSFEHICSYYKNSK